MKRLKKFFENVFLWRSLEKFLWRPLFWRALALVSLVLGLEHSCPWPRECLSSKRLSLALDFFVSLVLASSLVSSTPPLLLKPMKKIWNEVYLVTELFCVVCLHFDKLFRLFVIFGLWHFLWQVLKLVNSDCYELSAAVEGRLGSL